MASQDWEYWESAVQVAENTVHTVLNAMVLTPGEQDNLQQQLDWADGGLADTIDGCLDKEHGATLAETIATLADMVAHSYQWWLKASDVSEEKIKACLPTITAIATQVIADVAFYSHKDHMSDDYAEWVAYWKDR